MTGRSPDTPAQEVLKTAFLPGAQRRRLGDQAADRRLYRVAGLAISATVVITARTLSAPDLRGARPATR